jgi:hypothetical protein
MPCASLSVVTFAFPLQVPTADQVKRDDLTEALAAFQQQLAEVRPAFQKPPCHCSPGLVAAAL